MTPITELPQTLYDAGLLVKSLHTALADARRTILRRELHFQAIASRSDELKNETQRKAYVTTSLEVDPDYLRAQEEVTNLTSRLDAAELRLELYRNELKVQLALRTQPEIYLNPTPSIETATPDYTLI